MNLTDVPGTFSADPEVTVGFTLGSHLIIFVPFDTVATLLTGTF